MLSDHAKAILCELQQPPFHGEITPNHKAVADELVALGLVTCEPVRTTLLLKITEAGLAEKIG